MKVCAQECDCTGKGNGDGTTGTTRSNAVNDEQTPITGEEAIENVQLRRMRKQPTTVCDPRNFDHEAGDRVYIWVKFKETATMVDLMESRGWGKRSSGVLTPKPVTKNGELRIAVVREGIWYWQRLLDE